MSDKSKQNLYLKAIGKAIFLASISFSISSVEMSSKFSVINFAKNQEILDRAADALRSYMIIGVFWAVGTTLILYSNYGMVGLISSIICNLIVLLWNYLSYVQAFSAAAKQNDLKNPCVFCKWQFY